MFCKDSALLHSFRHTEHVDEQPASTCKADGFNSSIGLNSDIRRYGRSTGNFGYCCGWMRRVGRGRGWCVRDSTALLRCSGRQCRLAVAIRRWSHQCRHWVEVASAIIITTTTTAAELHVIGCSSVSSVLSFPVSTGVFPPK
jgi:hypothetical protein